MSRVNFLHYNILLSISIIGKLKLRFLYTAMFHHGRVKIRRFIRGFTSSLI